MHALIITNPMLFLSTLSLRRATGGPGGQNAIILDFYPRSPCGERLTDVSYLSIDNSISIHALLAESDRDISACHRGTLRISIHALLAESDSKSAQNNGALLHI